MIYIMTVGVRYYWRHNTPWVVAWTSIDVSDLNSVVKYFDPTEIFFTTSRGVFVGWLRDQTNRFNFVRSILIQILPLVFGNTTIEWHNSDGSSWRGVYACELRTLLSRLLFISSFHSKGICLVAWMANGSISFTRWIFMGTAHEDWTVHSLASDAPHCWKHLCIFRKACISFC